MKTREKGVYEFPCVTRNGGLRVPSDVLGPRSDVGTRGKINVSFPFLFTVGEVYRVEAGFGNSIRGWVSQSGSEVESV